MMLPVVLVSVLAGSSAQAEPPPAAMAPAPAELAPAPAPAELAPAPAPAELAPVPAEPSTVTVEVVTTSSSTTTVVVEQSIEPSPAPVVVVTPTPSVAPPPARWVPTPPSDERIRQSMRQQRRGAVGALAVGAAGMGAALGFQYLRIRGIERCAARGDGATPECFDADGMQLPFGYYSALGLGLFVAGSTGAAVMLGDAAASRDVQLRGREPRRRTGLKALGVVVIGVATGWMVGANLQLARHELQCDGDPSCVLRYRPLRFAANDGAAVGIAAGAGLIGYAVGYERRGHALARLRAAPSLSARHGGVSVALDF